MNTKDALMQLAISFSEFKVHSLFTKELKDIMTKNISNKQQFFNQLVTQLQNVKNMGCMVYTADHNEKIKGADGHYYSLHFQSAQYNIRFLVHISDSGECCFLSAFYERSGKSKTDYSNYIPTLESRFKSLLGDDFDER